MREVVRYKCDYCDKLAAKPETILRHEAVCIKNPEGKNCYMCEMHIWAITSMTMDTGAAQ